MCFFVFIFRNLLWGSVHYGQSLHRLHNTKSLRTPDLVNQPRTPNEHRAKSSLYKPRAKIMKSFQKQNVVSDTKTNRMKVFSVTFCGQSHLAVFQFNSLLERSNISISC